MLYKAGMILRNRYQLSLFIKLLEQVKDKEWKVMFYDNWRNEWGNGASAWLSASWLTEKYEPISRLAELVVFGSVAVRD